LDIPGTDTMENSMSSCCRKSMPPARAGSAERPFQGSEADLTCCAKPDDANATETFSATQPLIPTPVHPAWQPLAIGPAAGGMHNFRFCCRVRLLLASRTQMAVSEMRVFAETVFAALTPEMQSCGCGLCDRNYAPFEQTLSFKLP
jgi:hypothetical protein